MQIDSTTGLELQIKRTSELIPFDFLYTTMTDGETISSVDSVTQTLRGEIVGAANLTISNLSHDSNSTGQVWLGDGTNGEYYTIKMTVTTSIGAIRTCYGVVYVKDIS